LIGRNPHVSNVRFRAVVR